MLLGNADTIVQHLCLKLGWDLPLDPRQKGALAQSAETQAILGKRPSSSADSANESEEVVGPTRVGDRYARFNASSEDVYSTDASSPSAMCGCSKVRMVEGG
jgi:hypothetical protein